MADATGHVFLVWSDLTQLLCDAWLLPSDSRLHVVERQWKLGERQVPHPTPEWTKRQTRVMRFPDWSGGVPVPYLTNVVSNELPPTVGAAVEFVETAAKDVAKDRAGHAGRRRAKPLLALPLVGTGAGGKHRWAGDVVDALLPELEIAAARCNVDVALVLFDEVQFAAAQAVRRARKPDWQELEPRHVEHARRLAERAQVDQLVLFMGAGVSVPAGGPTWRELITLLAQRAGIEADSEEAMALEKLGPLDAARVVEDRLAQRGHRLHDVVRALVPNERFSLTHALLAGLKVKEAVTTNYDQLYERACVRPHGATPAALPVEASRSAPSWILKMHGSFADGDDLVLTRTDYLRYETRRAALAGIVQALLMTRHMLFIGYSLQDETFLRMVDAVRRAVAGPGAGSSEPLGTVLSLADDRFFEVLWQGELESLDFVVKGESESSLSAASRRQEIFLDCLLSEATNTSRFLLDSRYQRVLTPADQELASILQDTRARLQSSALARESRAWRAVQNLLASLGAGDGRR